MSTVKRRPRSYCLHLRTTFVMVYISRLYVEKEHIRGGSCLLKKAMGWPCKTGGGHGFFEFMEDSHGGLIPIERVFVQDVGQRIGQGCVLVDEAPIVSSQTIEAA